MLPTLRKALKSLCSSNGWSYAVFWRLKSQNSMILTWEDGHYESTKPRGISNISTFTAPDSLPKNWGGGGGLLDYGIRSEDGCSMQDQTELLLSKMSQQMHSLGEGIIGSVAFSGKHQWITVENFLNEWSSHGPLNPCSSFEYLDGWQSQLAAAIKTIAFIAAAPYGVVQLGSKQTIMEDLELVAHVKNLFGSVYNLARPVSQDSVQELLSGRIHGTQLLPGIKSGTLLHGIPKQSMHKNSSLNVSEQAPLSAVMDRYCTSWGMTSGHHETALRETVSNHVIPSLGDDFISAAFGIGSHSWDEDLTAKDVSSSFQDVMVDNLYPGSELFDVLHPAFKKCKTQDQGTWDDLSLPVSDGSSANFISHSVGVSTSSQCPSGVDILQSFDVSMDRGFEGGFYSDRRSEYLLDAVVANICPPVSHSAQENTLSNVTFSGLNGATSLLNPSVKTNSQGFQGETSAKSTSNNTSLKSQLSSWIEDSKNSKGADLGLSQAKKLDEPVKVNKKRAKPGESTRPRPKDRQQIQDRVKELREIVPNGTKCSIDALLERTIKHMLFLQSVTKHAEKLKHSGEQKAFGKDLEGGASWALEVGGQSMGCPIIVENMGQPRQMLVEMLCEERGLFLEIADIIRGLGLTILKGVMEARKDKIWARFAVEANRDVHRVEILWSLMQLLQQNTKNTTSASSQPSIVTDEGIDGSRAPNIFQQPQVRSTLSRAERLQ